MPHKPEKYELNQEKLGRDELEQDYELQNFAQFEAARPPRRTILRPPTWKQVKTMVQFIAIAIVALVFLNIFNKVSRGITNFSDLIKFDMPIFAFNRKSEVEFEVSEAVIESVQELSQLITVKMTAYRNIEINRPGNMIVPDWSVSLPDWMDGESLHMTVFGEVAAGVDLHNLTKNDVVFADGNLKITLPPAEIIYSKIDNRRTHVYQRSRGLLRKYDYTLEGKARQVGEYGLMASACSAEILSQANATSAEQIEGLVNTLNLNSKMNSSYATIKNVEVITAEVQSNRCKAAINIFTNPDNIRNLLN